MGFEKGWDTEFEDLVPNSPAGVLCTGCCFVVNLVLVILFFPLTVTQLGQFQYGLVRNKVTGYVNLETTFEPGRYWIGFWKDFITFPSTLNTIEFSAEEPEEGVHWLNQLVSRDKDGKQIFLDISVQYRLQKDVVGQIYRDMLVGYEDIYISELRDAFAKSANTFGVEEAWEQYDEVVGRMKARCDAVLNARFAECWGLQLWGVGLTAKYENKLIETQVRKQAMKTEEAKKAQAEVRATTQVMLAELRKQITVIWANGTAQKYSIEREAQATAQAAIIGAQARSLQIVKDTVCPAYSKMGENATCAMEPWMMNAHQLVEYQKMTLLRQHNDSHMIFNMKGGVHPQAMNVLASKNIMKGVSRRLDESQESGDEQKPRRASSPRRLHAARRAAPTRKARAEERVAPVHKRLVDLDQIDREMPPMPKIPDVSSAHEL